MPSCDKTTTMQAKMRDDAARAAFSKLDKDQRKQIEDMFWRLRSKVKNFGEASVIELALVLLLDKDKELAQQYDELWSKAKI